MERVIKLASVMEQLSFGFGFVACVFTLCACGGPRTASAPFSRATHLPLVFF